MPKRIRISGEIGWDITADQIVEQIHAANGDDLDVQIASPGGDVYDGLDFFNNFRLYKTTYPKAKIEMTIVGLAASMASYTAAVDVADRVYGFDNSVAMYHNPWSFAVGDYRVMREEAEFLTGLTETLKIAYAHRSGKSIDEITELMDNTTWLFGEQLLEHGFVDEILESGEPEIEEAAAVARAKSTYQNMLEHMREDKRPAIDRGRAAALMMSVMKGQSCSFSTTPTPFHIISTGYANTTHESSVTTGKGRGTMDEAELREEYPELADGLVDKGIEQEHKRVAALMAMKQDKRFKDIPAVQEVLDECISTPGKTTADANTLITAVLTKGSVQAEIESPGAIATGTKHTPTGETGHAAGNQPITEV